MGSKILIRKMYSEWKNACFRSLDLGAKDDHPHGVRDHRNYQDFDHHGFRRNRLGFAGLRTQPGSLR